MRFLHYLFLLGFAQILPAEPGTISGLVIPLNDDAFYLRNPDGQFEIRWTDETKIAIEVNTRQFANIKDGTLHFKVPASTQTIDFKIPPGPVTGIKTVPTGKPLESALAEAAEENWISEQNLTLHFGDPNPESQHLPSGSDPRFVGLWNHNVNPRTLSVLGKNYELSLKKGGQTNALLYGVIGREACQPFVNRATVIGHRDGDSLIADEIHLVPLGDQTSTDDPALHRYLFIGDSISGNYDKGLREALAGKFNIHHPPTNCGPSSKGKSNIIEWLGAYDQPGRGWDVISFNFGHWDAGITKAEYQCNLETVIAELQKTGAKLIWATTCPVPEGNGPAGDLTPEKKAPGRKSGVMKKYLNPWAAEVIAKHPNITTCDLWKFVEDNRESIYKDWWAGANVHFSGKQAAALGKHLADHIQTATAK